MQTFYSIYKFGLCPFLWCCWKEWVTQPNEIRMYIRQSDNACAVTSRRITLKNAYFILLCNIVLQPELSRRDRKTKKSAPSCDYRYRYMVLPEAVAVARSFPYGEQTSNIVSECIVLNKRLAWSRVHSLDWLSFLYTLINHLLAVSKTLDDANEVQSNSKKLNSTIIQFLLIYIHTFSRI
jgi:hypothetical protein